MAMPINVASRSLLCSSHAGSFAQRADPTRGAAEQEGECNKKRRNKAMTADQSSCSDSMLAFSPASFFSMYFFTQVSNDLPAAGSRSEKAIWATSA